MPSQNGRYSSYARYGRCKVRDVRTREISMNDVCLFAHKLLEQLGHDGGSVQFPTCPQALDLNPIDELYARLKWRTATDYRDFVAAFFQVLGQVVDVCFGASAPRRKETVHYGDSHVNDRPRTVVEAIGVKNLLPA